ncbi:hypothetical protein ABJI51_34375 [Amycolatopsis sp. NEAU-NG30]|uniref:Uncharacterized protein n=1 Tax=Amycolatopsis melonis TaxID=3156488 RepID=A0ABV0LPG4_9PSEU
MAGVGLLDGAGLPAGARCGAGVELLDGAGLLVLPVEERGTAGVHCGVGLLDGVELSAGVR